MRPGLTRLVSRAKRWQRVTRCSLYGPLWSRQSRIWKLAKVMEGNKIKSVSKFEKVLDCVIGLHNLRVLLKVNPQFDIPARRAAIRGEHIFKPLVPENEVDLKIPADAPDLSLKKYRPLSKFKDFLQSAAKAIENALELHGKECVFIPRCESAGKTGTKALMCCS